MFQADIYTAENKRTTKSRDLQSEVNAKNPLAWRHGFVTLALFKNMDVGDIMVINSAESEGWREPCKKRKRKTRPRQSFAIVQASLLSQGSIRTAM
jgi:hypothetical protein